MKITFRQIQESDFPYLGEIAMKGWLFAYYHLPENDLKRLVSKYYSKSNLEKCVKRSKSRRDTFVTALFKKKVIGFCHATAHGDTGELLRLYIDISYIGKGLGKRLLLRAEEFIKSKKCKKYFTFVNRHNRIGLSFYLRSGFVRIPKNDEDDEFEKKALLYLEKKL